MHVSLTLTFKFKTQNEIFERSFNIECQSGGYSIFNIQYQSGGYFILKCENLSE